MNAKLEVESINYQTKFNNVTPSFPIIFCCRNDQILVAVRHVLQVKVLIFWAMSINFCGLFYM